MLNAILAGIGFSQVGLLGIWVGSAANSWYVRLVGMAAGNGYFLVLGWISSQEALRNMVDDLVGLTACTLIMASALLIAGCFRVRISLPTSPVSAARRIQFSIRDLMVLTLVVACVVGFGRWLPSYRPSLFDLKIMALIYLPFVVIGLLSVWPALSARRPLLPCSIFVVIAGGVGMYFDFFGPHIDIAYWITITSAEALSLVASLLVVRSCGYRLVRLAPRVTQENGVA
jgi:hypothetical protein